MSRPHVWYVNPRAHDEHWRKLTNREKLDAAEWAARVEGNRWGAWLFLGTFCLWALIALFLSACSAPDDVSDGWAWSAQQLAEPAGVCAIPTRLEQPRQRYAEDTCWRVDVPAGFGLTEQGADCQDAPRCLLTRSTVVSRQLLDWTAEGEDNPETWQEVRCDEGCAAGL